MPRTDAATRRQYGALPFLVTEAGDVRVLLVTTRGRRDWIIPKGWPIRNLSGAATAAHEAYEEAGVIGKIVGADPIGCFRYEKQRNAARPTVCEVAVFLFAVERQLRRWPEKGERQLRWFAPAEASAMVTAEGLATLLLQSVDGMTVACRRCGDRTMMRRNGCVAL
jgi:8-oxo-dGTP pyrophosphatase MutT (NUDIX family)